MKTSFTSEQLATLLAVADTGSFERAAVRLHVTTSAVSQRIRALESACGQVLVRRGSPSVPTDAGALVLRHARAAALLEAELRAALGPYDGGPLPLPVAVNADSLATWFPAVFAEAATWPDVHLALHVDDEEHTAGLLRDGVVLAAVSTDARPVQGCRAAPLVRMTYRPLVRRELLARGAGPATRRRPAAPDLTRLPFVRFDAKDELQSLALRAAGVDPAVVETIPGPHVPDPHAFAAAVRAGLGWGMLPDGPEGPDGRRRAGTGGEALVTVPGLAPVVRELWWHRWKVDSPALDRLTAAVQRAARAAAKP